MALLDLIRRARVKAASIMNPKARLARRVMAAKQARAAAPLPYTDAPTLSFIVLSFNHRQNARPILDGLRRTRAEEVVVCEDGSVDGSDREWLRILTRPNEFLVRSNDIHEIRAYERAIGLARGKFVCVLQDDDIPPDDGTWVEQALDLFSRYPRLAILGAYQGYTLDLAEPLDRIKSRQVFGYRDGDRWCHVAPIPLTDPESHVPFMFVEGVSVGPIFYRRDVFLALDGFDLGFSRPGEPGILFDHEICLRAWQAGWQVGLFGPAPFRKFVGGQGTYLYGHAARRRNSVANMKRIAEKHAVGVATIEGMVADLNSLLAVREPSCQ
jgi:GT2 family glycosyltransferase